MASQTQDDSFHEIQLNGKQLVFLFMAATVVSVVIFLCGVLVGRGVRAERAATEVGPVADAPAPQPSQTPSPAPAGSDPTAAPPPAPAADDLTYFDRLEKPKSPAEQLRAPSPDRGGKADKTDKKDKADKSASRTERGGGAATSAPPATQPKAPSGLPASAAQPAEPAGQGYAVQIAALNVRTEAEGQQ